MKPSGGGKPSGELLELINRDFGSFEAFVKEFKAAAATQFGSGWAWLACEKHFCLLSAYLLFLDPNYNPNASFTHFVDKANRLNVGNTSNPHPTDEDKKLVVVKTPNAVNPLVWDYSVSKIA